MGASRSLSVINVWREGWLHFRRRRILGTSARSETRRELRDLTRKLLPYVSRPLAGRGRCDDSFGPRRGPSMERDVLLEGANQNSQRIIVFRKGASNQRNVTGPNCFVNTTAEIGVLRRSLMPVAEFRRWRAGFSKLRTRFHIGAATCSP